MKKGLIITFSIIGVAVTGFILKEKFRKKKFNKKCTDNGGYVEKSGVTCDFLDCDKSKFSCSNYG